MEYGSPLLPVGQYPGHNQQRPPQAPSSPAYPGYPGYNNNHSSKQPHGSPYANQYPQAAATSASSHNHYNTPNIELLLGNQVGNHNSSSNSLNNTGNYPTASHYSPAPGNYPKSDSTYRKDTHHQTFNNNNNSSGSPTSNPFLTSPASASSTIRNNSDLLGLTNNSNSSQNNQEFPGRGEPNEKYSSIAYLRDDLHMTEEDIQKARHEHVDPEPDMCLEPEQLRDYAGTAIFVYFRFLKFISIIIAIHFFLSLINYIVYAADQKPNFDTRTLGGTNSTRYWYSDFFITSYTTSQRGAYMATTIIGLVIIVIGLIIYRQIWIGWFRFNDMGKSLGELEREKWQGRDYSGSQDETILRYTADGHISVATQYRSGTNLLLRRLGSFLIFCGFVAVQVFSSILITQSSEGSQSLGASFAIAFIAAILNMSFTMIARKLTEFEKYQLLESADRSLVVKLVCFKMANLMAVYGAKQYGNESCVYDVIGEQFMTLLLVEIFFVTPSTVATAALMTRNRQLYAKITKGILGDDNYSARFELPVEYLAALYKFCISAMAMVVFPLSTLLAFMAFTVEFWAARYRLIKLCGKPVKSDANHRTTVVFVTFLIFVAIIATPFAGAAFVLSGRSMLETNTTSLCNDFPQVPPS